MDSHEQSEVTATERLVVPLHAPRRVRLIFGVISIIFTVGPAVWIALAPSWGTAIYGGGCIAVFAWIWFTRWMARRARGGAAFEIVATAEGISSPLWSLAWPRVARIWIGPSDVARTMGSPYSQALHIEPLRPDDVKWVRSRTMKVNARVGEAMQFSPIQILQANVDRPLEELAAELQVIAGRPLTSP